MEVLSKKFEKRLLNINICAVNIEFKKITHHLLALGNFKSLILIFLNFNIF